MNGFKLIIVFIIGIAIGLGGGFYIYPELDINQIVGDIEDSGLLVSGTTEYPSTFISGEIIVINSNSLEIKLDPPSFRNIIKRQDDVRIALIDESTEIVRLTPKPEAQILAEEEAFQEAIADSDGTGTPPTAPIPFDESAISLNELSVGQIVRIVSIEVIGDIAGFTASKISLLINE